MLVKDPSSRLTLDQVMQDTWLQRGSNIPITSVSPHLHSFCFSFFLDVIRETKMRLGDPPRGGITSSGGLISHPPPPYFHHPKDFKRITISKEDIFQVFNEGNASEGGGNGTTYTSVSSLLTESTNHPFTLLFLTSAEVPPAVDTATAAPIIETHPQLTDKELHERRKKFSKLAAAMARQKGLEFMYKANQKEGGDDSTETSEATESDAAADSNHSVSQQSFNNGNLDSGMARVDSFEFGAILDTLSAQPPRRPSTNCADDSNATPRNSGVCE